MGLGVGYFFLPKAAQASWPPTTHNPLPRKHIKKKRKVWSTFSRLRSEVEVAENQYTLAVAVNLQAYKAAALKSSPGPRNNALTPPPVKTER